MSALKSNCLPENIRRCMAPEVRKELKAPTSAEAQAKLDGKREKELQENIAAILRQRNIWFARQRMDKRATSTVGQPDFLFAYLGQPIAFEVKLPTGKLSMEQHDAITRMESMTNGWQVYVITSEQQAVGILNAVEAY